MNNPLPDVDLPVDFLAMTDITEDVLRLYRFPCRLKAGIFALVLEGSIDASINLSDYHIQANDFATLPPGTVIQFHTMTKDLKVYFAAFSNSFMGNVNLISSTQDFFPHILENPVLHLTPKIAELFSDYFALLHKALTYSTIQEPEIIRPILLSILNGLGQLYRTTTATERTMSRGEDLCRQFTRQVMKHYLKERSVSFYAGLLNISPQHLCVTVKQQTGRTVSDAIADVVIMDAKAQLKSTNLTIQEIAYSLNFINVSSFGKYFKRYVGMSPNEYRKS